MKVAQFRNMTRGELEHRLDELYQEQFNLRFQMASALSDNSRIRGSPKSSRQDSTINSLKTEV